MITFAIPFRAKETTGNWDECVKRLDNTIKSIFNQTDGEFKVIVAGNDIPDFSDEYDDRLEFIRTDIRIPHTWIEMARDKFYKLTVIGARIRQILLERDNPRKGIYVMLVDADDLVSRRIAGYVRKHSDENGYVSKDGYIYSEGKNYFRIYRDLHTFCGSCNIVKMFLEDLPENPPNPELCHDYATAAELNERYPIRYDHGKIADIYKKSGRPFAILPFRSTVYIRDTGDNISQMDEDQKEKDRFHPIAFLRSLNIFTMRPITGRIRKEFGMD